MISANSQMIAAAKVLDWCNEVGLAIVEPMMEFT